MSATDPNAEARDSVFSNAGAGATWQSGAALRAQAFGPATDLMMDLAGLKAGDHVLDIAAGTGDTSLIAARRVGPTGHVLATDLSPSMLEVAEEELRKAGLANVE